MWEELLSRRQYVTNWPFPQFGAIYDAYGAVVGREVEIHGRSMSVSKLAITKPSAHWAHWFKILCISVWLRLLHYINSQMHHHQKPRDIRKPWTF